MALFGRKKSNSGPFCSAVVAAAGRALRYGGINKLLLDLNGIPVLGRTLMMLEACPDVHEIVIAARSEDIIPFSDIARDFHIHKLAKVVQGGDTRLRSVYAAVRECDKRAGLIAIHDGARPFVSPKLISDVICAAAKSNAAAPALRLHDTIKQVEDGYSTGSVDRDALRAVQTPQVFATELIHGALYKALQNNPELTDDCAAVEAIGVRVLLVDGEETNRKVTTPADLELMRRFFL